MAVEHLPASLPKLPTIQLVFQSAGSGILCMFRPCTTVASFSLGCNRQALLHRLRGQPRSRVTKAGAAPSVAQDVSKEAMDPGLEQVVRCIHGSATKAAVYVTGGASQVRQA